MPITKDQAGDLQGYIDRVVQTRLEVQAATLAHQAALNKVVDFLWQLQQSTE